MAENQAANTTNATTKTTAKALTKSGARGGMKTKIAKRTKKQMSDDKAAFLRLQELLEMERARDGRSDVLITELERIEAKLKEQIFQDALGA